MAHLPALVSNEKAKKRTITHTWTNYSFTACDRLLFLFTTITLWRSNDKVMTNSWRLYDHLKWFFENRATGSQFTSMQQEKENWSLTGRAADRGLHQRWVVNADALNLVEPRHALIQRRTSNVICQFNTHEHAHAFTTIFQTPKWQN